MVKRRSPLLAMLLSIFPGVGQIYNGQPRKAVVFLAIDTLVPVIFGRTGILNHLQGFTTLFVFSILFVIYRMADGFIQARKLNSYELKPFNKWYIYVFISVILVVSKMFPDLPSGTGIQTFSIPTVSMIPTIQPGDRVVASLNYYDTCQIQYGDIVVFKSPLGGVWAFRVIGLPNDSIEIKEGRVYVNNTVNKVTLIGESSLGDQEIVQFQEHLTPTKVIKTISHKQELFKEARTYQKRRVPENEYFLMGDNRDDAYDSRFIGTIDKSDILGRVIYSYWGVTSDRINVDFREE
jgi:signal peptidase I